MNETLLFLALARLAIWSDFEAGVLEGQKAKTYTLVIRFPTGTVSRRIPATLMHGVWNQIKINQDELPKNKHEEEQRLKRIIYSVPVKTLHTMRF